MQNKEKEVISKVIAQQQQKIQNITYKSCTKILETKSYFIL